MPTISWLKYMPLDLLKKLPTHASPEERATFRERAENLRRTAESEDFAGLIPLAVIGLNGEYLGLDLDTVREFTDDISKITPIPCCPPHIVGNINLCGEIVTLVDVREVLNLPIAGTNQASKVMVVRMKDLVQDLRKASICRVR